MKPLSAIPLLFWTALITAGVSILSGPDLWAISRRHWKVLVAMLVVTAFWRAPLDGVFFHGLEYEDSYVYTVAGRQLYEKVVPPSIQSETPFSISVCAIGSLKNCQEWEPFPEHLLGYPYVISLASHVLRYSPSVGSFLNLFISLLSVLLVFRTTLSISNDPMAASLAGFAFATIPVFATYGLETSAEPFSAFCILSTLYLYLKLVDERSGSLARLALTWLAYSATLLFSETVKREDVLLALLLPAVIPLVLRKPASRSRPTWLLLILVLSSSAAAMFLSMKMHLFQTTSEERALLEQFPLTALRLTKFVWSFLSSFVTTGWYAGSFVAVTAGAVFACSRRSRTAVPVVLLSSFILLYAVHVRSYYEMESGSVSPQSALRFSMNVMGLWSMMSGMGLAYVLRWFDEFSGMSESKPLSARYTKGASTGALLATFILTLHLRRDEVEDEAISRLQPASAAVRAAATGDRESEFIVTMDPLVIQMYASPDTPIVDLESVNEDDLKNINATSRLILLKETDRFGDADLERYGSAIRYILALPAKPVSSGDGFGVLLIEPQVGK